MSTAVLGSVAEATEQAIARLDVDRLSRDYWEQNEFIVIPQFLPRDFVEATLVPQGTFAEAIRAGGAGIGAFFTPVGAGTQLAQGKEERVIGGVRHVLEAPIHADVALVYAARADTLGNLWYRRTARNFNPLMATAADVTIAEAGEILEVGELEPESVVTPHLYVDHLVAAA